MNKINILAFLFVVLLAATLIAQNDPLPSWNDGKAKQSIANFVKRVTTTDSKDYMPEAERISA